MFRLGLLENAFIIYETPLKPLHEQPIDITSYLEQPPHNLFAQKSFCPSRRSLFWKKSSHTLVGSTMSTHYFDTIVLNYNKISTLISNNLA